MHMNNFNNDLFQDYINSENRLRSGNDPLVYLTRVTKHSEFKAIFGLDNAGLLRFKEEAINMLEKCIAEVQSKLADKYKYQTA